ncbi:MAG: cupin domain-containing protein [Deltaproteobacteria bacterium]|nr:cupin domain-containing protein [Deltaproteobacteria bacterium]
MTVTVKNLFANFSAGTNGEDFLTLFENANVKISRIVSLAHSSPPGFWYDQAEDEWVIILRGSATLEFADGELVELKVGDWLTLARHVKHRVAQTSAETIWLSVQAV